MLINTGLFILIWETITVLLIVALRAGNTPIDLTQIMAIAGCMAPIAIVITGWVDRHWLSPTERLSQVPHYHSASFVDEAPQSAVSA